MTSLFQNLRVHQIFGANTDVGKTILTTALVRASASKQKRVCYLKPISTGPLEEADDRHVQRYGRRFSESITTNCLFRYNDPVSPHLAVRMMNQDSEPFSTPSDDIVVNSIANRIREYATNTRYLSHMYIETAGGVHSPCPSGTSQADCYRPLFLPTILIGDSKLGGISSTISSYESLVLRGYIIDAVVMFRDEYYRNWEYLEQYFSDRGVRFSVADLPPQRSSNPNEDFTLTDRFYSKITSSDTKDGISTLVDNLDVSHAHRLQELESMSRRTLSTVWWPFVQHSFVQGEKDVTVIDSAHADFFSVFKKSSEGQNTSVLSPEFDGSASWWTQAVGHAHPDLALAAARATGRYGHVMFPQATHLPALNLAEYLVNEGPGKGWASRAFFSDNGSTGMEVAIKMALRAYSLRQENLNSQTRKTLGILGLKGSYHGDTIGAMDACEEGVYTCEWHNAKGYWFEPPTIGINNGEVFISVPSAFSSSTTPNIMHAESLSWAYDVEERLSTPLARAYISYIRHTLKKLDQKGTKLGALVLEPLVMGAGGMIFVDPLFQRILIDVVRGRHSKASTEWSGLPVIFDEVFVGLHRIGMESAGPLLGVYPDISVNAKILTGGLLPLAVTLSSKSIFQAFLGHSKANALLHGHSYTAHAIGCEVANETIKLISKLTGSTEWKTAQDRWKLSDGSPGTVWSFWRPDFVNALSKLSCVKEVMSLGSVLSIKVADNSAGYTSSSAQTIFSSLKDCHQEGCILSAAPGGAPFGVHYRTLGDVAYFITSLNTSSSVIRSIEDKIWQAIVK